MLPTLQLGPLALNTPGLILIIGIWLGLSLAEKRSPARGVPSVQLYNMSALGMIAGILGARLAYVLAHWQAFQGSPLSILSLNPKLLDVWGGAALGAAAMLWYSQKVKQPLLRILDAYTPAAAVFMIAWHLSNLASGNAYGMPAALPWSIDLLGALRHPVQAYEALAALAILGLLLKLDARMKSSGNEGAFFLAFLALSAASRLIFEAFRAEGELLFGAVRSAQAGAWLLLALSLLLLKKRLKLSAEHALEDKNTHGNRF